MKIRSVHRLFLRMELCDLVPSTSQKNSVWKTVKKVILCTEKISKYMMLDAKMTLINYIDIFTCLAVR